MQVIDVGNGEPKIAVIGLIHGDEPCGKRAIQRAVEDDWEYSKPVRFIIANESAFDAGERYLDEDLNRAFNNPDGSTHESNLAQQILSATEGFEFIVSLHSTHSTPRVFGLTSGVIDGLTEREREVYTKLSIRYLVDNSPISKGRLVDYRNAIDIECGYQQSEQASDNAYEVVIDFLAATGAIPENTELSSTVQVFQITDAVPLGEAEFLSDNFKRVKHGEVYARVNEEPVSAGEEFYPVLMSTHGYENLLGYKAQKKAELIPSTEESC